MKIALVHDWIVGYAGGEKVLEQLILLYPDCDVFTLVDFLDDEKRFFMHGKRPITSLIQNLPLAKKYYRYYLFLMPFAIEQFDLGEYDLIISSSAAISKGVITGPDQLHICYCHSPIRYAWDLQHQYLKESNLEKGFKGFLVKIILHYIRLWDLRTANAVDYFVSNSNFIKRRIYKVYRRNATIIYPPVDIKAFSFKADKCDYYLAASRLVPYKKMRLIIQAFNSLPDKKLKVIGDGPDMKEIRAIAGENIEILGYQAHDVLVNYMQNAKCFVFAALEDFGIIPVEAQACGTPVIAYAKGGALETVEHGKTGFLFKKQTVSDLVSAVDEFERSSILPQDCRKNAERYSIDRFRQEFGVFAKSKYNRFFDNSDKQKN